MALKDIEVDDKELELETWPAFVDILSSTVVVLAFAFFILVVLLSIVKITSADSESNSTKSGGGVSKAESIVLSEKSAEYQKLSIVSPPTLAKNQSTNLTPSSNTTDKKVMLVPENSKVTDKEIKVTEIGESNKEVLGEIPKFTDSRVMEVLKELVTIQQDVIDQQRKVIDQQDTQIKQTVREYQSLLALVTKVPEVEDIKQKITPKPDVAKFNNIDDTGNRISGTSETPNSKGIYVLNPPEVAIKNVTFDTKNQGTLRIKFNDNANYLNEANMDVIKKEIANNIDLYKSKGVVLIAKPSDFAISSAEGKRIAVDRLVFLHSILINMGINKSMIRFKSLNDTTSDTNNKENEDYGWVEIVPNI